LQASQIFTELKNTKIYEIGYITEIRIEISTFFFLFPIIVNIVE